MPIRNMWSLEPGEVLVAEHILKDIPDCQVYFPMKDTGIDLLVVRGERHVGIQVKESSWHERSGGHSWHQVSRKAIDGAPDKQLADLFVFLTYHPDEKKPRFRHRYIITRAKDLKDMKSRKKQRNGGRYGFYFQFSTHGVEPGSSAQRDRVFDIRDGVSEDYTCFLDKWLLVGQALS